MQLPSPIVTRRFTPPDIKFCNPDAPVFYNNPMPTECISSEEDVIRLAKRCYKAEEQAWERRNAGEILETIADAARKDLEDCQRYLRSRRTKEAVELAGKLARLYLWLKAPAAACLTDCLEAIYIHEGMEAVEEVLERLADEKARDSQSRQETWKVMKTEDGEIE